MSVTKVCSRCGSDLPADTNHFHRNRRAKDGLCVFCKSCACLSAKLNAEQNTERVRDYHRTYGQMHKAQMAEYKRAHRQANIDRIAAYDRARNQRDREQRGIKARGYYLRHRTKIIERSRQWAATNPDAIRLQRAKMNARRRGLKVDAETNAYIATIINDPCSYCGRNDLKIEIDHIIPVSAGGGGLYNNLAPACRSCNRAKAQMPLLRYLIRRVKEA